MRTATETVIFIKSENQVLALSRSHELAFEEANGLHIAIIDAETWLATYSEYEVIRSAASKPFSMVWFEHRFGEPDVDVRAIIFGSPPLSGRQLSQMRAT